MKNFDIPKYAQKPQAVYQIPCFFFGTRNSNIASDFPYNVLIFLEEFISFFVCKKNEMNSLTKMSTFEENLMRYSNSPSQKTWKMIYSWGSVCLFEDVKISIFRTNWKTKIGPGSGVAICSEQLKRCFWSF